MFSAGVDLFSQQLLFKVSWAIQSFLVTGCSGGLVVFGVGPGDIVVFGSHLLQNIHSLLRRPTLPFSASIHEHLR
jgi:hypothetical protein